jgi:nucleoside-diphosphate-sugar epimerase
MASGQTTILAGYSGFVGGNLAIGAERCGHPFDMLCNSVNITEAFGTRPDMLVYAGVRAEKFTADSRPEEDWEHIKGAAENIGRIAPLRLVLISTIDVYDKPADADENTPINAEKLRPYGGNRLRLERMAREVCPDTLVVRLPA